jgi:hypothetical protein
MISGVQCAIRHPKGGASRTPRYLEVNLRILCAFAIKIPFSASIPIYHLCSIDRIPRSLMVNNRQKLNQLLQSTPFLSYFKSTLHYREEQISERPEHAQLWRGSYSIQIPELPKVSGEPATSKAGAKKNAAMKMAAEVTAYRDVCALNPPNTISLNLGHRNYIFSLLCFITAPDLPSTTEADCSE